MLYHAVDTQQLLEKRPLAGAEVKRRVFVTSAIDDLLDGKDPASKGLYLGEIHTRLDSFILGHTGIRVSMAGESKHRPDFERLKNLEEVWAVCARKPLQFQFRIFGRFLAPDTFIGLSMHERHDLASWKTYEQRAAEVISIWSNIFGNTKPFCGAEAADYFTGGCRDVDK